MPRRGPHNSNITWTPHVRIAWGGTLGNTAEVWTNSVKYVPSTNAVITAAQAAGAAPAIFNQLGAWMGAGSADYISFIGKDAKLSWVKINSINGDGLQYDGDTNVYETTPVIGGGGDSQFVPFYQTYAISLMTAKKRGRAHIGRIYPPCVVAIPIASTGMQDPTNALAQAKAFSACLKGINQQMNAQFTAGAVSICSPGNALKNTVPIYTAVTGCTVDTIPDTQHRRTNRLKGVRSAEWSVTA